jgi:predicted DNA-binding transcriptional regulator AlpA
MTKKIPEDEQREPLHPHFIYRKTSKVAQRVIGLGITQINEEIAKGTIPRPLDLTGDGRAQGWTGAQLLEMQQRRLDKAEAARQPELQKPNPRRIA